MFRRLGVFTRWRLLDKMRKQLGVKQTVEAIQACHCGCASVSCACAFFMWGFPKLGGPYSG